MNSTIHFQHRVLRVRFGLEAWSFQYRVCHDGVIEGVSKFSILSLDDLVEQQLIIQLFSVSWRILCKYLIFLLWTDTSPTTCRLGWVWKGSFLNDKFSSGSSAWRVACCMDLYNRKMGHNVSWGWIEPICHSCPSQHIQHTIQPYWCPSNVSFLLFWLISFVLFRR